MPGLQNNIFSSRVDYIDHNYLFFDNYDRPIAHTQVALDTQIYLGTQNAVACKLIGTMHGEESDQTPSPKKQTHSHLCTMMFGDPATADLDSATSAQRHGHNLLI